MSALDLCCVFMKELRFHYRVPAEMHLAADGSVRVHIQRQVLTEAQEEEIVLHALRLGLKQQPNTHWITLSG